MSYFRNIVTLLTWAILVPTDVAESYKYWPDANGWVAKQPIRVTWDEAFQQCRSEGAILMSPIGFGHLQVMQALMDNITAYHIGTKTVLLPRAFVSVEGVSLVDMPITDMLGPLDPQVGLCLAMNRDNVFTMSCTARLPYLCYKEHNGISDMTECGTYDRGYQLNNVTGSCYKYHHKLSVWTEAYWTCVTEGGYLAIVNDAKEAQELVKFIPDKTYYPFIGLRDWRGNGDWMSVHRDPIQELYNIWEGDKQPTSPCCYGGSIHPITGRLRQWIDTQTSYFICEKNPNNVRFHNNEQQQQQQQPYSYY